MHLSQGSWSSVFLGELCHIKIGRTPDRANSEYWGSGHPWLSITDMQQGKNLITTKETITQKAVDECRCYQVQPGTLLMSFKLSIGKLGFARLPMYTNEAIAALQLKDQKRLSSDYLYYALQAVDLTASVDRAVKGMTLNTDKLNILSIPLPSPSEQKRIAAILEKADRLRRLRRYALELSSTYLQSVFLEMFGDPTMNPKHWPTGRLHQLCNKIVDCPHSTPIYSLTPTSYACIRSSDIQGGSVDWSATKYVDNNEYQKRIQNYIPVPNDVVYCREGARFGNAAIIPNGKKVCLGQRMMLFQAASNIATPEFIWAFLESESTYKQADRIVSGSAAPHLNVGDIKEFITIIPPLALQQEYAHMVKKYESLRAQQKEAERQAEHLFQTLLHKAFQGELSLDEGEVLLPDGEIASQQTAFFADIAESINTDAYQLALPIE